MAGMLSSDLAQQRQTRKFMPEIQALRAVAVGLVVAFHLYPGKWFTGGFVGVDVFFVISGYLITAHLLREADRTGTVNLPSFYARRVRRLLPASLLVLFLTFIVSIFLLPARYLLTSAREVIASTFYVENLWLASKAVTYSASNDVASPVQHYWSLSAEEQFYFIWPALILLGLWLGRRFLKGHTIRTVAGVLVVVFTASLVHSLILTAQDPAAAYFVTTTRVWQFATGALTAFLLRRWAPTPGFAVALRWLGLAAVVWVSIVISQATPFPGWWAIPPTLGTAMVIVAGDTGPRDPLSFLANLRPVQWFGDVSYAVYLWHWPLIVFTPYLTGDSLRWFHKVVILVATGVLAHFTRLWVEQPGQNNNWLKASNLRTFVAMLVAMAVIAGSAFAFISYTQAAQQRRVEQTLAELNSNPCLGAGAVLNAADCPDAFATPPLGEVTEADAPWGETCEGDPRQCWQGPRPERVLALVGDSHAESLFYAIKPLADAHGWGVVIIFEGGCPPNYYPSNSFNGEPRWGGRCSEFAERATETLRQIEPDLIVTTAYTGSGFDDPAAAIAGYQQVFADWLTLAPVTVIRDYPTTMGEMMPDCLARNRGDATACAHDRAEALGVDLQYEAAMTSSHPGVTGIDLTDFYCDDARCYAVVGQLPVYFDSDHITKPFAQTLSVALASQLVLD